MKTAGILVWIPFSASGVRLGTDRDGRLSSLPSSWALGLRGLLLKLAIDLVHHVSQNCNARRDESSDYERLNRGFDESPMRLVVELWRPILRQLVARDRHQPAEFIKKNDLTGLAGSRH